VQCPKKILVIGISGTGKSTLSRELAAATGLPLTHMDSLIWRESWQEAPEQDVQQALERVALTESWVVEGWIDYYSHALLAQADLVVYLDFPGWRAAWGGVQRWWRYRGKRRPELPEGCVESLELRYLKTMLLRHERPHIEAVLAQVRPKNLVRVRSRQEGRRYLSQAIY
jgi:adenylate kinase family enzyme